MKALKYIGWLLLTLIGLFLILGIFAPKKIHVDRSTMINAPAGTIQDVISRFSTQKDWTPWLDEDPNTKITLAGEDGKVGSTYSWESPAKNIGKGVQTLTKTENGIIISHIKFDAPQSGEADVTYSIKEENGVSKVNWALDSEMPYPFNTLGLFMNMDKQMGPVFETGLSRLKKLIETQSPKKYRGYAVKETDGTGRNYVGIRKTISFQELPAFFAKSYAEIGAALKKAGVEISMPLAGLYYNYDEKTMTTDVVAAAPIKEKKAVPGLINIDIPAGKELSADFYGAYEKTGDAHYAIDDYMKEKGYKTVYPVIEAFMNDPMTVKDTTKWWTQVIYPVTK